MECSGGEIGAYGNIQASHDILNEHRAIAGAINANTDGGIVLQKKIQSTDLQSYVNI